MPAFVYSNTRIIIKPFRTVAHLKPKVFLYDLLFHIKCVPMDFFIKFQIGISRRNLGSCLEYLFELCQKRKTN